MSYTVVEGYKKYNHAELMELIVKIKAVIYARVSSTDQVKKYSLASQIEYGVNYAKKQGIKEDEILVILEKGEMGDNPDRPALNLTLELIENGVGKKLVVLHPDRLSRYLSLQNQIAEKVWNAGCDLEFVEFDVDPSNPESMLMFNIQGSIAQYNKAKILANSKRGRKQKVKDGKIPGIRRAFGYTFDKEKDTLVENPEEKKTYQLMVEWLLKGKDGQDMTCTKIAQELAKMNISGPDGSKWYSSTVSRILRDEKYLGVFYWGKTEVVQKNGKKQVIDKPKEQWIAISIPQYIDQDTFNKVQKKLDSLVNKSKGRKSGNYLLKGLVRCGQCGSAIGAGSPTILKGGGKIRYYSCSKRAKKNFQVGSGSPNERCASGYWRQDTVDEYVWCYILDRLNNPEQIIEEIIKQQGQAEKLNNMKKEIHELENTIERKLEEQKRCFKAYREGIISLDELKKEIDPIKANISQIEEELEYKRRIYNQITVSYNELEQVKKSISLFYQLINNDKITFNQKKDIVRKIIDKVILHEDAIEIVTKWKPEGENTHSNSCTSQGHGGL